MRVVRDGDAHAHVVAVRNGTVLPRRSVLFYPALVDVLSGEEFVRRAHLRCDDTLESDRSCGRARLQEQEG